MNKLSQHQQILKWLKRHKGITKLQAIQQLGIMNLGGRTHELRQQGYPILTYMQKRGDKRFAVYYLSRSANR